MKRALILAVTMLTTLSACQPADTATPVSTSPAAVTSPSSSPSASPSPSPSQSPSPNGTASSSGAATARTNAGAEAGGTSGHSATAATTAACGADYYRNSSGQCVHRPIEAGGAAEPPAGASAKCKDGSYSFSQHRQGTCSSHGGVAIWY